MQSPALATVNTRFLVTPVFLIKEKSCICADCALLGDSRQILQYHVALGTQQVTCEQLLKLLLRNAFIGSPGVDTKAEILTGHC